MLMPTYRTIAQSQCQIFSSYKASPILRSPWHMLSMSTGSGHAFFPPGILFSARDILPVSLREPRLPGDYPIPFPPPCQELWGTQSGFPNYLLPPKVYLSRKLELEAESGLKPRFADLKHGHLKAGLKHYTKYLPLLVHLIL